jgi:soluble lytic murein transglycosylase-like protein/LysM repeat protein
MKPKITSITGIVFISCTILSASLSASPLINKPQKTVEIASVQPPGEVSVEVELPSPKLSQPPKTIYLKVPDPLTDSAEQAVQNKNVNQDHSVESANFFYTLIEIIPPSELQISGLPTFTVKPDSADDTCSIDDQNEIYDFFKHFNTKMVGKNGDLSLRSITIVTDESSAVNQQEPDLELNVSTKNALDPINTFNTSKTQIKPPPAAIPDIELYTNRRIKGFIRIYTSSKRYVFVKAIERSATYLMMIHRIFKEYGLPPNLAYLAVVESNFNPDARSSANAVGLWQFMSYTGKSFGLARSWWHDERYDPEKSTVAAAKYLKHLHKRFKGNWELAMAAYNSGSGTVRRAIRKAKRAGKPTDYWSLKLPRETRGYVPAFYAVATIFKDLEKYGFEPLPQLMDLPPKRAVVVAGGVPLKQISEVLKIDSQTIRLYNPSIRLGGLTPAVKETFTISLPAETQISPEQMTALENLKEQRYKSWKYHTVRPGESLWSISRNYRIPIQKIERFNRFRRKNLLRIGQKLILPVPNDYSPPVVYSKTGIIKKALDKLPGITWVHTVKKGDTLWRISQIYKVPLAKLKHWNRIALRKRVLSIGSEIVLKLPGSDLDSRI